MFGCEYKQDFRVYISLKIKRRIATMRAKLDEGSLGLINRLLSKLNAFVMCGFNWTQMTYLMNCRIQFLFFKFCTKKANNFNLEMVLCDLLSKPMHW